MSVKSLLCITQGSPATQAALAALEGWEIRLASSMREAGRLLQGGSWPVGLLLDLAPETRPEDADAFLRRHGTLHWVAALPQGLLAIPAWRELAVEHLYDYHTLPLDPLRLLHTLGHAWGCARLRADSDAPAAAHPAAPAGKSAAIARLRAQIARVARADAPVLIGGESGSGKELTAQAVHAQSARARGPFVAINCGAIAPALIQSELFGYVRGAFTGAARDKAGLIESAAGGTIFFDEIADLPRELQSTLLRFLQEKTIYRIGSTRAIAVDVRVIAASHADLQQAVEGGLFREDLYYRLNVLPLTVPPLRERGDDLDILAAQFFHAYAQDRAPRLKGFSRAALQAIRHHQWPGNVRELINRVRRAMVLAEGRLIAPHDLGLAPAPADTPEVHGEALGESRIRAERLAIEASLARTGGNVTHAARELGISRMTLYRQMAKHGLAAPDA